MTNFLMGLDDSHTIKDTDCQQNGDRDAKVQSEKHNVQHVVPEVCKWFLVERFVNAGMTERSDDGWVNLRYYIYLDVLDPCFSE